jgi:hypothetical protein
LAKFGFRTSEILVFKLKIQINSKKPGFWKEESVEDMVTLRPTAQATLVLIMMQALRPFTSLNHLLLKKFQ